MSRILSLVLRVFLGGLFVYAGFTKLYPAEHRYLFEMALSSYRLLPAAGVIAIAAVLPWLEIALGVLLLAGFKPHYTGSVVSVLLVVFISIMASTYFRGIQADCGCFGFGETLSGYTLGRDLALLLIAGYVAGQGWWALRSRQGRPAP